MESGILFHISYNKARTAAVKQAKKEIHPKLCILNSNSSPILPMDKTSTQLHPSPTVRTSTAMQPRRTTIERLRQFARATFAAPVAGVLVMN